MLQCRAIGVYGLNGTVDDRKMFGMLRHLLKCYHRMHL